ncbi:MAG: RnfABCDGE type electron transport complex subunit G [Lachnospiraceae bacterium]|jgi:electron transport complex protein RnfG|nr:RnfABCDGE type electron transport complex subunit G [Lachnospiraceae bacterium]
MKNIPFLKDALILCAITLVAGVLLGAVNDITQEPIAQAQIAAKVAAYRTVYADAADFSADSELSGKVKEASGPVQAAGLGSVTIDDAVLAKDAGGRTIGYVVTATSKEGYGGDVTVSVGVTLDGEITGIEFPAGLSETPGLGMRATEPTFKDQFKGKSAGKLTPVKGGGAGGEEIDAMNGATITSTAVTGAVNAALYFVANHVG